MLRFSRAVAGLRAEGLNDVADGIVALKGRVGSHCPIHGTMEDPIIATVGDRVAFGCPWCSGTDVLEAWKREGES